MSMDTKTIFRLLDEANDNLEDEDILTMAFELMDIDKLKQSTLTPEQTRCFYLRGGFLAGIKYTLENLEAHEEQEEGEKQ